jgi:hypothetical protein
MSVLAVLLDEAHKRRELAFGPLTNSMSSSEIAQRLEPELRSSRAQ